MMRHKWIKFAFAVLLLGGLSSQAGAFVFVESDLQIQVDLPRAWKKEVRRKDEILRLHFFYKDEAMLSVHAFTRPETTLDLEIESKLDRLTGKYGTVKVLFERPYPLRDTNYTDMKMMLIEYERDGQRVYELTLYARFENVFHAVSGLALKKRFEAYRPVYYKAFRTLRIASPDYSGRNDSFRYLSDEEKTGLFSLPPAKGKGSEADEKKPELKSDNLIAAIDFYRPYVEGPALPRSDLKYVESMKPLKAIEPVDAGKPVGVLPAAEPLPGVFNVTDESFLPGSQ